MVLRDDGKLGIEPWLAMCKTSYLPPHPHYFIELKQCGRFDLRYIGKEYHVYFGPPSSLCFKQINHKLCQSYQWKITA